MCNRRLNRINTKLSSKFFAFLSLLLFSLSLHAVTLSGVVKDQVGNPVNGAKVRLFQYQNGSFTQVGNIVTVGASGAYNWTLSPGSYVLSAFFDAPDVTLAGKPNRVVMTSKDFEVYTNTVRDSQFEFVVLSGKVVDSNRAPISNVSIQTGISWLGPEQGLLGEYSQKSLSHANGSVKTDSHGNYVMLLFSSDACIASGHYADTADCLYDLTFTPPNGSGFATAVQSNVAVNRSQNLDQTLNVVDLVNPKIVVGPYVKSITDDSVIVEWQSDEPVKGTVQIVGGDIYSNTHLKTQHSIVIYGLAPGTTYAAQVSAKDANNNSSPTSNISFTTAGSYSDTQAPQFLQSPSITALTEQKMTVSFCANEPVSGKFMVDSVEYPFTELATCHELTADDLVPNQTYAVSAEISDAAGNGPKTSHILNVKTLAAADLSPPLITGGPTVTDITNASAVVRWKTNEPSSSQLSFNDGNSYRVQNDPTLVTDHVVTITGLSANTRYSYTVSSHDVSGNATIDPQIKQFVTASEADTVAPVLIGRVSVEDISNTSAMVSWKTDESASTVIYLGTASNQLNRVETSPGFSTQHQLTLTRLLPSTTYYYAIESGDLAGNQTRATTSSFTTNSSAPSSDLEIISQPIIERLTGNSITLSWTTNMNADSRLVCESPLGISEVNKTEISKNHILTLIGLDFNTAYRCAVYSTDITGQIASKVIGALTTEESDSTAPQCVGSPTAEGFVSYAEVRWESDELATGVVNYRQKGASDWLQTPPSELSKAGFTLLNTLSSNTVYEYQISLTDVVGNQANCALGEFNSGSTGSTPDLPAPVFSINPVVSDIGVYSATVSWSTERVSSGLVRFGLAANNLNKVESVAALKTEHSVVLNNLKANTTYYLQVDAFNSKGVKTTSSTLNFITDPVPQVDLLPPKIISGPFVKNISQTSAVVEWDTDKAANSKVVIAGGSTFTNSPLTTRHSVLLTGLSASTNYTSQVSSTDAKGLSATPLPANFRTLDVPDNSMPVFVMGPVIHSIDFDKFTVSFCASEPVRSVVKVDHSGTAETNSFTIDSAARCHDLVVRNRTQRTQYDVLVSITDLSGNGPVNSRPLSVITLFDMDIQPPIITGPVVTDVTQSTAIVRWTTNETATSGVIYSDGRSLNQLHDGGLVKSHTMYLSGLTPSTVYSLFATSTDAAGNGPAVSGPVRFTTLGLPDTKAPSIIAGPYAENITTQSADIVWTTNESASHKVYLGLSQDTLDKTVSLTGYHTAHRVPVSELSADTLYYFQVESADLAGNKITSEVKSFKTLKPEVIPPTLKITAGPDLENATTSSLTVSWETNLASDSRLVCEAEEGSASAADVSTASTELAAYYSVPSSQAIKDQYIVLLKEPSSPEKIFRTGSASTSTNVEFFGLSSKQTRTQRKVSINALAMDISAKVKGKVVRQYASAAPGFMMRMRASELHALRQDPRVLLIEQDQVMSVTNTQSGATWGLDRIDQANLPLNSSYTYSLDGTGVNAYIIDTGILTSHSDFGGRAVSGWDFIDNDANAADCNGHGTHVAGTVGGSTWGVAKNVKLYGVRVLGCDGGGTSSGVLAGVDWVTENAVFPAVANMSLGGGNSAALDASVERAINAGITFAVAAGNSNINACSGSPNKVPAAITVASSTSNDSRSSFSNWGACVDIFAPGSDITSTWHNGGTNTISGTSMATPHVAGAVALYLQAHPNATPAEVTASLKGYATQGKISGLNGSPNLLLKTEFDGGSDLPAPPPAPPVEKITFEVSDSAYVTSHLLTLNGLDASTVYSCTVYSADRSGTRVNASLRGTTTDIPDTEAPECSEAPEATGFVDSAQISWASNELTTAVIKYRELNTTDWLQSGTLDLASEDSVLLTGLLAETAYELELTLTDVAGNSSTCPSTEFSTVTPAAIPDAVFTLQPVVSNITEDSATVNWTTSEPSTGLVRYGKVANNLSDRRSDEPYVSSHRLNLHNLSPNTVYYLQVDAFNILGEKTTSDIVSFTTLHIDRDLDNDGISNDVDNCPLMPNPDQTDSDNDGAGDACDPPTVDNDLDRDGVINDDDNCPLIPNPSQQDSDNDGLGDACDTPIVANPDLDNDGVPDTSDNCPRTANPDQADRDNNGIGDVCDVPVVNDDDYDDDGVLDNVDNCPTIPNADQTDTDHDGIGDPCDAPVVINPDYDQDGVVDGSDNCPLIYNPDQADRNSNGLGDACDAPVVTDDDYDDDGVLNPVDNCPRVPNADQSDTDNDGIGDACDTPTVVESDVDHDGILDGVDNCPLIPNPDQADRNNNGIGDACDAPVVTDDDYDDDGILNNDDNCPLVANPTQVDSDNDGLGDACDTPTETEYDYDKDGIPDREDNCPLIANPDQADRNNNGKGDACDLPETVTPPPVTPVGINLSGIVTGEGVPIEGAEVAVYSNQKAFLRSVSTDTDGAYLFKNMLAGDYFIGVSPPADSSLGSPTLQPVRIEDRDVVRLITLIGDAITLSGYLKDSQGRVIDNILVSLHQQTNGTQVGNSVRTDAQGFFKFSVAPGNYKLRPLVDVFNPSITTPVIPAYPVPDYAAIFHGPQNIKVSANTALDVTLPFALLSGETLDSQGNPVAGVGLSIRHQFSSTSQDYYLENYATDSASNAISDANGHFEFALFTDQTVDILLTPPASRSDLAVTTISGYSLSADASETFSLVEGQALSGTLKDTQGRPIDRTKVTLHRQDSGAQVGKAVYTDANGVYRFQVENGIYKIKPHLNPFGQGEGQRPVYPLPDFATVIYAQENIDVQGATQQDVILPLAILSGKTTDGNGAPIANTRVTISHIAYRDNGQQGYYLESQGKSLLTHALTNPNGEFSFALFTDQKVDITFVPPLNSTDVSATLISEYQISEDTSETFVLNEPYILSGYLKDEQGVPLDHTMMTVHNQSNRQLARAPVLTDANGYFKFKVASGSYQLRPYLQPVNQVDGVDVSTNYPVPDFAAVYYLAKNIQVSGNTYLDLKMPMSVLSGKALDANGVIVPGVKLRVAHSKSQGSTSYYLENQGDGPNSRAITASDGRFSFGLFTHQTTDISVVPSEESGFAITNVSHTLTQETSEDIWLIHSDFAVPTIIAGPYVKRITAHSAVVEWTTDKPGSSVVDLSNGRRYENTPLTTHHSVVLTDLNPQTLYQADVHSVDKEGRETQTRRTSFTTLAVPDYRAPLILEGLIATAITHTQFTVSFCADEPVTGLITLDGVRFDFTNLALCHELVLDGLSPNTLYTVIVEVKDEQGNGPTISQPLKVTTLPAPDLTPPVIQLIPMVIDISATHATVIWTTDEASTSGVSYNDGSEFHVVSDPAYVKQHVMPLTDLTPETTYTLTVSSTDRQGNGPTISQPISFTTLAVPDTTAPVIIGSPLIQNITHQNVVIRWETSEPASTRLIMGTSSTALNQVESKNGLSSFHNLAVTGLQPDTIYYFQVQTADAEGNLAMSEIMSFRTKVRGHQGNPHFMTAADIIKVTSNSVTVYWETDVNADARLVCESISETLEVSEAKRSKQHTLTLTGLQSSTTYVCTAYSTDHQGYTESQELAGEVLVNGQSQNGSSTKNFLGKISRLIDSNLGSSTSNEGGVSVMNINTGASADITAPETTQVPSVEAYGEIALMMLSTNEPSAVFVEYRLLGSANWQAAGSYEQKQLHQIFLQGLSPNSNYELRYVLADLEANRSQAQVMNFSSGNQSGLQLPAFSAQPAVSQIATNSALIEWTNARTAFGQVSIGRSMTELLDKEAKPSYAAEHQVKLVNLEPATIYYAQVTAYNLLGQAVNSHIVKFVTSAMNATDDSDGDGLPDSWEIENGLNPQNSTDATEDLDSDGLTNLEEFIAETDPNDADTDSDGIPDGWEVDHQLNPNDSADAALDADNNGRSNLNDYLSSTDLVSPVISLIREITLNARGPLTAVPSSNISASDNVDGVVTVVNTSKTHLPPGRHLINWLAVDSAGNRTLATQIVNVNPQVLLSKAQTSSEGNQVRVNVKLSGFAPVYPVEIAYSIAGSADLNDYSLSPDANVTEESTELSGVVLIEAGMSGDILLDIADDQLAENDEFLTVTLSNPVHAVLGANTQQRVTITETNVAPSVSLQAEQKGLPVTTISANGGLVTIRAMIVDVNSADSHDLDWSATDNRLADTDSDPLTLTVNPMNLTAGVYTVGVSVSDDGLPSKTVITSLNLKVISNYPTLSASLDSDGDGINDRTEGYQDSDFDGIPDYLDAIEGASWLQQQVGSASTKDNRYLMQVDPGVMLTLGATALLDANGGAKVSDATLAKSAAFIQFGQDTAFNHVGGVYDFEITQISPAGSSVQVVIPLQAAIPAQANYRKLDPNTGWQNFVTDANNRLYSSAGEAGVCPAPGDSSYQAGLTAGHYCVMMRIQDGGANDADGLANGTVVDPGSVASAVPSEPEPPTSGGGASSGGGGGGSIFWLLWISACLAMWRIRVRK